MRSSSAKRKQAETPVNGRSRLFQPYNEGNRDPYEQHLYAPSSGALFPRLWLLERVVPASPAYRLIVFVAADLDLLAFVDGNVVAEANDHRRLAVAIPADRLDLFDLIGLDEQVVATLEQLILELRPACGLPDNSAEVQSRQTGRRQEAGPRYCRNAEGAQGEARERG